MSAVFNATPLRAQYLADIKMKLELETQLESVIARIHAATNVDQIMLELGQAICGLVSAERLTIYALSDDRTCIVSKLKTGLTSFKDLKLPISEHSIAGFVAQNRAMVNIKDVYDADELHSLAPQLRFLDEIDKRSGFRCKQMLAGAIVDPDSGELMGVVQALNTINAQPFSQTSEQTLAKVCEALAIAFRQRRKEPVAVRGRYDALVANALLSLQEMELVIRSARRKNLDVETILLDEFQVGASDIGEALAIYFTVPYEPYKKNRLPPVNLLRNLKREFLQSSLWVPMDETEEGVTVVTTDPEKVRASRVVINIFHKHRITYRVTTAREFVATLDQFFSDETVDNANIGEMLSVMGEDADQESLLDEDVSLAADNELVKLVNKIIIDAYNQGASDIHIEPYPGKTKIEIRFRKDGTLVPYISVPASYRSAIVARLKIMCDLDISEKRKPQDGKIKFRKFGPLDIELRVATIPSAGNVEDIVMRLLSTGEPMPLDKLGLSAGNMKNLKETVSKPYGLFIVCGPTGSGKTTTLHSVLGHLNTSERKIWTAEDPVEITQKGLRQVQMNAKAGLNFASAMRAFLRADPDIIMVGEMRDKETTAIGIEASLTGHLVFTTLHTNSAPESIVRLLDMGMDPFNFADALLGVLAQRLAKRLCSRCKQPHIASQEEVTALLEEYCLELKNTEGWRRDAKAAYEATYREWLNSFADGNERFTLYTPVGCEACNGSGYKGRAGLHELLVGTDAVKKLIQEKARVAEVLAVALNENMRTLKQDGIEKVLQGITDMHQVRAVCIK